MAYQKGKVQFGRVLDTQTEGYDRDEWFYLPHSCDEWVIGTREQAEQLIADLQALLQTDI